MTARTILVLLTAVTLAAPLPSAAQTGTKVKRIGFLEDGPGVGEDDDGAYPFGRHRYEGALDLVGSAYLPDRVHAVLAGRPRARARQRKVRMATTLLSGTSSRAAAPWR